MTERDYAGRTILVTGGTGFIGTALSDHLRALGASVDAFSRHDLDITDAKGVRRLIAAKKYDTIFHLAAMPAGNRTPDQLAEQARTTLGGTINLAEALIESGNCETLLVQVGSSEEYGAGQVPFFENQSLAPISPYSAAKASASQFLLMAHASYDLPVIIARPSVVFGPGQKAGMVIPYLFSCYRAGKPAQISPGEQSRDFLFIDDCIRGLSLLGRRPDLAGEVFNLGSGEAARLKDVAAEIAHLCEYSGDLGLGSRPYRRPEVMHHRESVAKALDKLNWQAEVELSVGLAKTFEWWQQTAPVARQANLVDVEK